LFANDTIIVVPVFVEKGEDDPGLMSRIVEMTEVGSVLVLVQVGNLTFPTEHPENITVLRSEKSLGIWGALHLAHQEIVEIVFSGKKLPGYILLNLAPHFFTNEALLDAQRLLQETDIFITHHGLSSTHEAILHRVPMISYPFFWDQPTLATRCQELGIAIPLADSVQGPVQPADVTNAMQQVAERKIDLLEGLETARAWERQVMADREAVLAPESADSRYGKFREAGRQRHQRDADDDL